ncbi:MAG: threonine/serine exporter family protein [Rikenellaceae bacterium]
MQLTNHKDNDLFDIADIILEISTTLMGAGSHTSRVVINAERMAKSFGCEAFFTIFQKNITVTIKKIDSHESITMIRATKHISLNFRVVSELSALSWDTSDHTLSIDEVKDRYQEIMAKPRLSRWVVLLMVACANASFCKLFDGDAIGMAFVFVSTFCAFFVRQEMMDRHMNHSFVFIVAAFISSFIAGIGVYYNIGTTPQTALATSVLFLIPGVPLINSIMDVLEGHILTGISRFVNASILIISITIGFLMSLLLHGFEKL